MDIAAAPHKFPLPSPCGRPALDAANSESPHQGYTFVGTEAMRRESVQKTVVRKAIMQLLYLNQLP
jgi:hypothetical protein